MGTKYLIFKIKKNIYDADATSEPTNLLVVINNSSIWIVTDDIWYARKAKPDSFPRHYNFRWIQRSDQYVQHEEMRKERKSSVVN